MKGKSNASNVKHYKVQYKHKIILCIILLVHRPVHFIRTLVYLVHRVAYFVLLAMTCLLEFEHWENKPILDLLFSFVNEFQLKETRRHTL